MKALQFIGLIALCSACSSTTMSRTHNGVPEMRSESSFTPWSASSEVETWDQPMASCLAEKGLYTEDEIRRHPLEVRYCRQREAFDEWRRNQIYYNPYYPYPY